MLYCLISLDLLIARGIITARRKKVANVQERSLNPEENGPQHGPAPHITPKVEPSESEEIKFKVKNPEFPEAKPKAEEDGGGMQLSPEDEAMWRSLQVCIQVLQRNTSLD